MGVKEKDDTGKALGKSKQKSRPGWRRPFVWVRMHHLAMPNITCDEPEG